MPDEDFFLRSWFNRDSELDRSDLAGWWASGQPVKPKTPGAAQEHVPAILCVLQL